LERLQKKVKLAPERGNHRPEEVAASIKAKANGIIAEELAEKNLMLRELETMKKIHPVKAEIALTLRKETTMTWAWMPYDFTVAPQAQWPAHFIKWN